MDQVSRPMQIALVAVVLFAALYFVALKPKPTSGGGATAATAQPAATSTTSGSAPGVNGLTSAINKAHGAVGTSQSNAQALADKSAQASGDTTTPAATTPATSTPAATKATTGASTGSKIVKAKGGSKLAAHVHIPKAGPGRASAAIADHKVLAVLFYNPRATDDRAVLKAFKGLNTHKGKVVLVAAPIGRLASYRSITAKVAVTGSPTFIVLDRHARPRTFVGFVDPDELTNHVADALHGFKAH